MNKWLTALRQDKYAFIPGSEMNDILVELGASPSSLSSLPSSFSSLPPNPAMDYKFAAEASVLFDDESISRLPVQPFILYADDMEHPDGLQGKERLYEELPDSWVEGTVVKAYAKFCKIMLDGADDITDPDLIPQEWDSDSSSLVVKQWPARTVRRSKDGVGEVRRRAAASCVMVLCVAI